MIAEKENIRKYNGQIFSKWMINLNTETQEKFIKTQAEEIKLDEGT